MTRPVEVRLPLDLGSPAVARRLLREECADLPEEVVDVAQLLATELVTNAVMHARSTPLLTISPYDAGDRRGVMVEVADENPRVPDPPPAGATAIDLTATHGRGLSIVDSLASSWGVRSTSTGKAIWFALDA